MAIDIQLFPVLNDNYAFLIRDQATGKVASIDTPDAAAIAQKIDALDWGRLDYIFNTHWHPDHTGGNQALKDRFDCKVLGPQEVTKVAPLDQVIHPGDEVALGDTRFEIMDLRGHTAEQIGYINRDLKVAFVGDCLFVLGCGRLREGSPADMWMSLTRLMTLPEDTLIYSAHEYALDNLRFAESVDIHDDLAVQANHIRSRRAHDLPTVPSRLGDEIRANPFLKLPLMEPDFEAQANRFGKLRALKDQFR